MACVNAVPDPSDFPKEVPEFVYANSSTRR